MWWANQQPPLFIPLLRLLDNLILTQSISLFICVLLIYLVNFTNSGHFVSPNIIPHLANGASETIHSIEYLR